MVTKISVFVLHWHSFFKLCQWGAFCRHSILHPWFNQGVRLEWPSMYPKNHDCITYIHLFLHYLHQFVFFITCINSYIAYHKNDLEILTVVIVLPVFKLDRWIKRYCMIKLHGQHALCLGVWLTSSTFLTRIFFYFNEKLSHHPLMK